MVLVKMNAEHVQKLFTCYIEHRNRERNTRKTHLGRHRGLASISVHKEIKFEINLFSLCKHAYFLKQSAAASDLLYLGLARIIYRTNNISCRKNIVFGGCGELTPPEIYK